MPPSTRTLFRRRERGTGPTTRCGVLCGSFLATSTAVRPVLLRSPPRSLLMAGADPNARAGLVSRGRCRGHRQTRPQLQQHQLSHLAESNGLEPLRRYTLALVVVRDLVSVRASCDPSSPSSLPFTALSSLTGSEARTHRPPSSFPSSQPLSSPQSMRADSPLSIQGSMTRGVGFLSHIHPARATS